MAIMKKQTKQGESKTDVKRENLGGEGGGGEEKRQKSESCLIPRL